MRFSVRHETLYRYSASVALAPHVLRLNPRIDQGATLLSADVAVEPTPVARQHATDAFGNRVTHVNFDGATEALRVVSTFALENRASAPLRDLGLPRLPWSWQPHDGLAAYQGNGQVDDTVRAFATTLADDCGWAALPFLELLSQTLFARLDRHIRLEGVAQTPVQTLASGRGACRDLTVLFMAVCRSLGIAARFVSGYQAQADTPDGRRHLHAWPEVFLPGIGWRGFDPTHGIAVSDGHVALCAAPEQAATMPIEGGFYFTGDSITSTLDYAVNISTV